MKNLQVDTNINILGGLPDFDLIKYFLLDNTPGREHYTFTDIRSVKSVSRFKKAIIESFVTENENINVLFRDFLSAEKVDNLKYLLFLMLSYRNDLFRYLNIHVFLPVYFSGRKTLRKEEVVLCLKDLAKTTPLLQKWGDYTLDITASKYLTLLKKLGMMQGIVKKEIVYQNISFQEFVFFTYFLAELEPTPNKLKSDWLPFSFYETDFFMQLILDKKMMKYLDISFSGDNLKIKTLIEYKELYNALKSA